MYIPLDPESQTIAFSYRHRNWPQAILYVRTQISNLKCSYEPKSPIIQYIGKLSLIKNSNINSQIVGDYVYSIGPWISNTGTQISILKFSYDPKSQILQYIGKWMNRKISSTKNSNLNYQISQKKLAESHHWLRTQISILK